MLDKTPSPEYIHDKSTTNETFPHRTVNTLASVFRNSIDLRIRDDIDNHTQMHTLTLLRHIPLSRVLSQNQRSS
jgi:hypothetical protein